MLATIISGAILGIDGFKVDVQIDIARGLTSFATVGLAEGAVRESKERVKAALKNQGYPFPGDRITVNLAPADIRKDGSGFDLPMAVGLLTAQSIVPQSEARAHMMVGELGLDGTLAPIKGALALALAARAVGLKSLILPKANGQEAAVVPGVAVRPANTLGEVINFLTGHGELPPLAPSLPPLNDSLHNKYGIDLADVRGQERAKRALAVAAAGGHNILFIGPPGSGKTMMAQRLPTILPPLSFEEAIETTKIYSAIGLSPGEHSFVSDRPFRSPHHTISDVGLIGGGRYPKPGEVSLAHNGVLFLDELPEFKKSVLEVMRQPLEDGQVSIARAASSLTFPARFMLVAAMNPCPCGHLGDSKKQCRCQPMQIQKYRAHISGPLLDRLDIHLEAPAVEFKDLTSNTKATASADIRQKVCRAREIQTKRLHPSGLFVNAQMNGSHLKKWAQIDTAALKLLETAVERLGLSARAYSRILKLARTIADLGESENISQHHLAEAISYRSLDRRLMN
ncbi:MAG: YifB family Mg chelatase-like AAA ATPase [Candidatus Adiutrix sp.]